MTAIQFYGYQKMTYLDYIDLATGKTLVVVPGQTYNVMPAAGRSVPATPTDGRFTLGGYRGEEAPEEDEPEIIPALELYPALSAAMRRRVPEKATSTSEVKE